ncbi:TonB-dependent receptor [Weeksellaceae bacterium KMM 9713]|uniref:TonB-dependent receptor n=1 Tax=Profundicola chukchiensis TaxID=2961959 RepID=A0A9X4N2L8_9FLAO|nr:carboxypeptidase-like regulatory domain-containing protein [Profundicola chukchiensis]MDG4945654.1 TonB-dependent receptor [Profundicola chukchiensis]
MIRIWLTFVVLLLTTQIFSQTKVTGTVKSSMDEKPMYNINVLLNPTNVSVTTDRLGFFQLSDVAPGDYTIEVNQMGYDSFVQKITVGEEPLELGDILLSYNPQSMNLGVISLSDEELSSDESSSQSSVGLLSASKDVFAQAAAYELGAYWFRTRGYDNKYSDVMFNGVRMNKVDNDRVDFGNWGGLNDVTRYPAEVTYGLEPSDYTFGDLGGVMYIDTRPSTMRTGTSLSYSLANRSYRQRVMATHNTGLNKNGWGFMASGSRRWANEGRIDGTFYDAWAYYLGAEKKFNDQHTLNLTVMGAPYRRSTNSPATQEIYDLMGTGYNAYWGYQNGEKRSERIKKNHEPMGQLTHHWDFSENSKLTSTISYQTGKNGGSRLDWYKGNNPSPIYYRRMPSFDDSSLAAWQNNDTSFTQINWQDIYTANLNQADGHGVYALVSDVNEDDILAFSSTLRSQLNDKTTLFAGVNYKSTNSEIYRELDDLLGAQFYWDIDDYADPGQSGNYDESNPNRKAYEGDRIQYNYETTHDVMDAWASANFKVEKFDVTLGGKLSNTSIQRNGLFDNYQYTNSYGESEKHDFLDYGAKLQLIYKINGRNFITANGAYYTNAPTVNDVFPQGRENNSSIPDLESTKVSSADINYILRGSKVKARVTGYFTKTADEVETSFGYLDFEDANLFTAEVLSGVDKQYFGTEIAVDAQLTTRIRAKAVASIGQYTYANNPDLYYFSDDYAEEGGYRYLGTSYLKDYKLAVSPQKGYSLGFEYRDPKYWWFGVTGNFLADNYVDISPSRRTDRFIRDQYGDLYPQVTEEGLRRTLQQEKFDDQFMLNANAGKTFRFGDYYMGISLTVNNVLDNKDYRTGGFEQLRVANYNNAQDENYMKTFGNKYWYDQGLSYFLNVFLRF